MRFEDTPELFGSGCGISTCGDIKCHICGTKYNEGADKEAEKTGQYGYDSIGHTDFAGVDICYCCFEKIEEEVWQRRKDIIYWMKRRLENIKKRNDKELELMDSLEK